MFGTCVQQPMGLLVCITRTAVACLSVVIASLFMVACRQQRLISGFNGAVCDSGSKYSCSVSFIRPLLGNGEAAERERERVLLSWASGWQQQLNSPSSPLVISQTGPGSRAIYCLWWKGVGRGSIGTRQVQQEDGVRSLENRNQRWGQMTASLASGVRYSLSPLKAPKHSKSLFLPWHYLSECLCISARVDDYLCVCTGVWAPVCVWDSYWCVTLGWKDQ